MIEKKSKKNQLLENSKQQKNENLKTTELPIQQIRVKINEIERYSSKECINFKKYSDPKPKHNAWRCCELYCASIECPFPNISLQSVPSETQHNIST